MATAGHVEKPANTWRAHRDLEIPPILASALVELHENGYHGTTVRKIAAGVPLTMPSLYYHYGSKEGVLFALLDIAMDDLLDHIEGALEEAADDISARLANFVTAIALHNTRRLELARLHDEFRFLSADTRGRYVAKRRIVDQSLADLLDEGSELGVFDVDGDSQFASRAILGMLSGISDWYVEGGPLSAEEIAARYVRMAQRLVGDTSAAALA